MMEKTNKRNYADVVEDARELITATEEKAKTKGVLLASAITDVTDRCVFDENSDIKRIMTHVLDNAVKYTNEGGRVCYSVTQMPSERPGYSRYIFETEDTGAGISSDLVPHIFDPVSGGGFGMPEIKQLVERMEGFISVDTEQGEGTCVRILLDLKVAG